MVEIPSPAIAVVGRHNSGKTTLVVKLIAELALRGYNVGSVKHHTHGDFEIDHPGKDSYRHREAGATETVIASPVKLARVKTLAHEMECADIVDSMPGHDIVVVEGYRKSGLPTIEIMRAGNERDVAVAEAFSEAVRSGRGLQADSVQASRGEAAFRPSETRPSLAQTSGRPSVADDISQKMPDANTVAIVTDIPLAAEAASSLNIPVFDLDDVAGITDFLEERYTRPRITVVIQAGGESRRMGQSKALVKFRGRPLICRLIERLCPAADELVITTNEADKLEFLDWMYPEMNIRLVPDAHGLRGALPGLYTAFASASYEIVAVVACDMVFASPNLVVAESIEMAETGADVVVPVNNHGFEPFHATYRKSACEPAAKRAMESGERRAQALFADPEVRVLEFPHDRVLRAEPRGGCFVNTNTPEELAHIENSLLGE